MHSFDLYHFIDIGSSARATSERIVLTAGKEGKLDLVFWHSVYYYMRYAKYSQMLNNGFLVILSLIIYFFVGMGVGC